MDFMLLLLGIALVSVICAAQGFVKGWKQPRTRPVTKRPMLPSYSIVTDHASLKRKRELRSISIKECETLINASEGVLFVSINEAGERGALPFYNMYALVMTPRQFADEIRWFPHDSCVVLCGDVSLCCSALGLLENAPERPPIYMLRDTPRRWDVAQTNGQKSGHNSDRIDSIPQVHL
jgi:hypothetical protein